MATYVFWAVQENKLCTVYTFYATYLYEKQVWDHPSSANLQLSYNAVSFANKGCIHLFNAESRGFNLFQNKNTASFFYDMKEKP